MVGDKDWELAQRALGILHRLSLERTGWWAIIFGRWYYPDEPLRNDAANLVREAGYVEPQPFHTRKVGDPHA